MLCRLISVFQSSLPKTHTHSPTKRQSITRHRLSVACIAMSAGLIFSGNAFAVPITYAISGDISSVDGSPFGTTINVGDKLNGTVIFDPESTTPFSALSFSIGTNTYKMTFAAGTVYQYLSHRFYILGYNIGTPNTGGDQWIINGASHLVSSGDGQFFPISFRERDENAPDSPTLRLLDSPLWDQFRIQVGTNGLEMAAVAEASATAITVPEPTSMAMFGIGAFCFAYRKRHTLLMQRLCRVPRQ